jgi:hypothetical protein
MGALLISAVLPAICALGAAPGDGSASAIPTTEQVVARMMEADRRVTPALRNYTSVRQYSLENLRFGNTAEITVRMSYRYPGHKEFRVLSGHGLMAIRTRVLHRMLESELEAARDDLRDATQITPQNYSFRLLGSAQLDGRNAFILEATPKVRSPFLFRGRVWVDAEDYAIARIEGTPAQSPSFWVKKTAFVHQYGKFGPFWLAVSNHSDTDALIFGRTVVRIEYSDYRINEHAEGVVAHGGP